MNTDISKEPEYLKHDTTTHVLSDRATACVNALDGIQYDALPEVAKAWVAWKIWHKFGSYQNTEDDCQDVPYLSMDDTGDISRRIQGNEVSMDEVIATAQIIIDAGYSFGPELDELIRRLK